MVGQIIHEYFQLGEIETKWERSWTGKHFNILEIMRSGLSAGAGGGVSKEGDISWRESTTYNLKVSAGEYHRENVFSTKDRTHNYISM